MVPAGLVSGVRVMVVVLPVLIRIFYPLMPLFGLDGAFCLLIVGFQNCNFMGRCKFV